MTTVLRQGIMIRTSTDRNGLRLCIGWATSSKRYSSGTSAPCSSFDSCSYFINLLELVPIVGSAASATLNAGVAGFGKPSLHPNPARRS
jgi:hypothetical protein